MARSWSSPSLSSSRWYSSATWAANAGVGSSPTTWSMPASPEAPGTSRADSPPTRPSLPSSLMALGGEDHQQAPQVVAVGHPGEVPLPGAAAEAEEGGLGHVILVSR